MPRCGVIVIIIVDILALVTWIYADPFLIKAHFMLTFAMVPIFCLLC